MKFYNVMKKYGTQALDSGRNLAIAAFVGSTALVGSANAGVLADAVTSEVTSAKAEATLVGVAILGVLGFFLLLAMVKRSAKA